MLSDVGTILTGLALAASLYAVPAAYLGIARRDSRWGESARRALYAAAATLAAALLALAVAFLRERFEIAYVAAHASRAMPTYLKLSAVWAGQEGSLLVWSFLQALFAALAIGRPTERMRSLVPWATLFLGLITAFFVGVTLFHSNPFVVLPRVPDEGQGLNPLLRHPGMIFHPPALYVGYVGLAIPFAFALAALAAGRVQGWTAALRPWTLVAWLGLGLGLLLGMRWAYDVLGWGGYWGWDPVENAGLLPWLTATALLHGAVMQDERRGFELWNVLLAILSFVLVLFGTFATRSGVIQSVHAYAVSNLGGYYLAAIAVALVGSLALVVARRDLLSGISEEVAIYSRDGAFFLTLVLFLTLTVSIFIGSILPTLTDAIWGRRFEAGPEWFDRVTGPQFGALLFFVGVCPLLGRAAGVVRRLRGHAWILAAGALAVPILAALAGFTRPVSLVGFALVGLALASILGEFAVAVARRRRQVDTAPLNALGQIFRLRPRTYGGYLVHLGVVLMAVGVLGTRLYPLEREVVLSLGERSAVGDYALTFESLGQEPAADHVSVAARVSVSRDGVHVATLAPRFNSYQAEQSVAVPAVYPGVREDLYLVLAGWSAGGSQVTLKVVVNALVNFLWVGGLLFLLGGLLALWPWDAARGSNLLALAVSAALLGGAAWSMWGIPHGVVQEAGPRPVAGDAAPDLRLVTLAGETISLADLRGEVVVVNFWSPGCPPCVEEIPDLQAVWERYRDAGVTLVGVVYESDAAAVAEAVEELGIAYPVALDPGDRAAALYGITGVPETFVVGPNGVVAYVHIGPVSAEVLAAELDLLLGR